MSLAQSRYWRTAVARSGSEVLVAAQKEVPVDSLRGLGWKAPLISWTMVAFLVSLTGLPPTVGFYGKYLLFVEGIDAGLAWLVVVAAINSVISLFYYFRVAKALFLADPSERVVRPQPMFVGFLAVLGILTVLFALFPGPIETWARSSLDMLGRL